VIDAYALSLAALLLTAGSLADLVGRRLMFGIGIGIFSLGSLLCGVAPSTLFLTLARAGQGIGGAIVFATGLALLAHAFRGPDRGIAFAVWGAIAGIAVAIGPVLGGAITSGLSWRWIFLVNVPIGAATLAAALLRVDESRDPAAHRPAGTLWIGRAGTEWGNSGMAGEQEPPYPATTTLSHHQPDSHSHSGWHNLPHLSRTS